MDGERRTAREGWREGYADRVEHPVVVMFCSDPEKSQVGWIDELGWRFSRDVPVRGRLGGNKRRSDPPRYSTVRGAMCQRQSPSARFVAIPPGPSRDRTLSLASTYKYP